MKSVSARSGNGGYFDPPRIKMTPGFYADVRAFPVTCRNGGGAFSVNSNIAA